MYPDIIIGSKYVDKVIPLVQAAKDNIKVIVFDWRVYPYGTTHPVMRLTDSFLEAKNRNVDIKCLVNTSAIVMSLRRLGLNAQTLYSDKLVHAKILIFDDCRAVVGSHNLTQNGLTHNLEVSTIIELNPDENHLVDYFNNLWPLSK